MSGGRSAPEEGAAGHPAATRGSVSLGLRQNVAQFTLLVAVNVLVGGTLDQERTVLPLLAEREFGLTAYTAVLTYILAFGLAKALTNYLAGAWSDRYGRKPVLVAGWIVALPVPLLLIWAPSWGWVVAAKVLLGVNQGLTWSTTVIMKIDPVGSDRRGLATGLNEGRGLPRCRSHGAGHRPSGSACRPSPSGRPATTPAWRRGPTATAPTAGTTTCTSKPRSGRCSSRTVSRSPRCPRPARPAWLTTSMKGSPGAVPDAVCLLRSRHRPHRPALPPTRPSGVFVHRYRRCGVVRQRRKFIAHGPLVIDDSDQEANSAGPLLRGF